MSLWAEGCMANMMCWCRQAPSSVLGTDGSEQVRKTKLQKCMTKQAVADNTPRAKSKAGTNPYQALNSCPSFFSLLKTHPRHNPWCSHETLLRVAYAVVVYEVMLQRLAR